MLPGIDIVFQNGALGQVAPLPDGCMALVAQADEVSTTFKHNTHYVVKSMQDVAALGLIDSVGNHRVYKFCAEYFQEGGTGQELHIMVFPKDDADPVDPEAILFSSYFTTGGDGIIPVVKLLDAAEGRIRGLFAVFNPSDVYTPMIENGIDKDVMLVASRAQAVLEDYTDNKKAPAFCVTEGYSFSGTASALSSLTTLDYNRVAIMIGDTESNDGPTESKGAALGILAGRLAAIQVHENAGKVRLGALTPIEFYIKSTPVKDYDVEQIHDKGFITVRTFVGRSGFFISDDHQATAVSDDYRHITHRRVIDKAFRIAYDVLLSYVLDDVQLMPAGTVSPIYAKTLQGEVISAIYNQMSVNGELSIDSTNPADRGVICVVDLTNNVASTSRLNVTIQVRPKGHARYINVPLGFIPVTQE